MYLSRDDLLATVLRRFGVAGSIFGRPGASMKALFADVAERSRQRNRDVVAYQSQERRRVLALCDAVQIAVAMGQPERADRLLEEMHAIVDSALARRSRSATRLSA